MKHTPLPLFVGDFLFGTTGMTNQEVGIYIKLLAMQWDRGALPDDERELRAMSGHRGALPRRVLAKFVKCEDGLLRNVRLEAERAKRLAYKQSRAKNGSARWSKPSAYAVHMHSRNDAQQETFSLQTTEPEKEKAAKPRAFSDGDGPKRIPTTDQAKRIASIVHRRVTTPWNDKEYAAYRKIGIVPEEDLAILELHYAKNWPPRMGINALRHDLYTLLNNFYTEVERARAATAKSKSAGLGWSAAKPAVPIVAPPLTPEELAEAEQFQKHMEERRKRKENA